MTIGAVEPLRTESPELKTRHSLDPRWDLSVDLTIPHNSGPPGLESAQDRTLLHVVSWKGPITVRAEAVHEDEPGRSGTEKIKAKVILYLEQEISIAKPRDSGLQIRPAQGDEALNRQRGSHTRRSWLWGCKKGSGRSGQQGEGYSPTNLEQFCRHPGLARLYQNIPPPISRSSAARPTEISRHRHKRIAITFSAAASSDDGVKNRAM